MIRNDIQFANGLNKKNMNKHCTFFYNDQDLPAIYTRGCIVYMLIKYLIIEECAKHKLYRIN
jgi:CMP-N-acetylneuraminic acid synthetase